MTETPATEALPTVFPAVRPSGCPFDPATEYAALRRHEGIVKVATPVGVDAWIVSRHDEVREAFADPRLSSRLAPSTHMVASADVDRKVDSGSIVQIDGEWHAYVRRLLASEFTVKRVEALRPWIQDLVEDRIDALLAQEGPVDFMQAFALPIPSLVICELLGVPYADRDEFQERSAVLAAVDRPREEVARVREELSVYIAGLLQRKRAVPEDDLLSRLIMRSDEQERPLTLAELVTVSFTLLIAGYETTANMIGLSTLLLLRSPDQLAALRADPALAPTAVEELLRYITVLQFGAFRHVLEDLSIGGETIKAGEYLIAAVSSANRDERVFPDPDRLDLSRKASAHLAFGFGPHQCLGQQLARVELYEVYTRLYRRIPTLRLAVPFEEIQFRDNTLVYGVRELPVTWDREEA